MLRTLFLMLTVLSIVASCKKKDDTAPQPATVDFYHTIPAGKTWCNGPSDPTQQMMSPNSYTVLTETIQNDKQKFMCIDNGDTLGPYVMIDDSYTVWRKFYCQGDYDTYQWKHTDTSGTIWSEWKRDTIKYNQKTEIFY